jgi:hypothetical protein
MHRDNIDAPNGAQDRRRIDAQARLLAANLSEVFCGEGQVDRVAVDRIVSNFSRSYFAICTTPRERVAIHESAHAIGFEATGAKLKRIKLYRDKHVRASWGGAATSCNPPLALQLRATPKNLLSDAIATMAGPMAEELYAEGVAAASASEILLARACVTRAAGLTGEDDAELWLGTLENTAALLHANRGTIGDLAALLMEKTEITRSNRAVKKILSSVRRGDGIPIASLGLIERLSEVAAFLAEVRE